MLKILFLTTAHRYDDDRIFYHQAKELKEKGYLVKICSLCSEYNRSIDGIEIESYSILEKSSKKKSEIFQEVIRSFLPDCIICSEPLAVIASKKFKEKKMSIIYDITEWYPSFRMLQSYSFFSRFIHAIKFFLIQIYAGFCSTHFIFGEVSKKFPLAYIFPFKKNILLPYYPHQSYVKESIKELKEKEINLCYTGRISKEDGIENFFKAAHLFRHNRPEVELKMTIVGAPKRITDKEYFSHLLKEYNWENISIRNYVPFTEFTDSYTDVDICFDLRERNFEYNHCLPIKLFYYAGSGKPVIYSHLKAIENHIDISKFGYLVDPEDAYTISSLIENYIDHPNLYDQHARFARKLFTENFNWDIIRDLFTNFIRQSIKR
ncbi:glycosyltransferase [Chryseobacterium fistulae]|nr:glycosyltransferase [Chryseobacterium fistulae]